MGAGGGDQSGALQARNEQLEQERQDRIRQGAADINTAFQKFDQPFYNDFQNRFLDFYTPQLDQQLADARAKISTGLADRGMLESSAGLRALGRLQDKNNIERTTLANQAIDQANQLKGQVENQKSDLYALNEASADPSRMGPLVSGAVTAFAAPQSFTPLEDVFASVINSAAMYNNARNSSVPPTQPIFRRSSNVASPGSSGSGRVVN